MSPMCWVHFSKTNDISVLFVGKQIVSLLLFSKVYFSLCGFFPKMFPFVTITLVKHLQRFLGSWNLCRCLNDVAKCNLHIIRWLSNSWNSGGLCLVWGDFSAMNFSHWYTAERRPDVVFQLSIINAPSCFSPRRTRLLEKRNVWEIEKLN